jgi:hypothetical protein
MPDAALVEAAARLSATVAADFAAGSDPAIVVRAGAGAGKSGLVTAAATAAATAGLRVAVTAPTNAQVADLVRRCATSRPGVEFAYLHASSVDPPADVAALPNVTASSSAIQVAHAQVVLATNDKFAYSTDDLPGFDRMLLDEAYQADSTRYLCVAGLAPHHLLVGDAGQLDPFSTVDCTRWRGQAEDPLLTAIGVLLRNHPSTRTEAMPLTRRLPPSAVQVVQPAFYGPALPFRAATLPDDRGLRLGVAGHARRSRDRAVDAALDLAVRTGWAHVELPAAPALLADPQAADLVVALVTRLATRAPETRSEKNPSWRALGSERVAIAASHNDQVDLVRARLDSAGLRDVLVSTANRLQGLEFDLVVAWHPLAGLPDLDEFHLDPGRACVMLTRHRHACILVGRAGDRDHVRHQPPTTPAYLGWDPDPILDGWEAHRHVFAALEPHVIAA